MGYQLYFNFNAPQDSTGSPVEECEKGSKFRKRSLIFKELKKCHGLARGNLLNNVMVYLLLGEGGAEREKRIFDIREKILPSEDFRKFDYEVLYATKLTPQIFKERLLALPTLASNRLLVIHQSEDLSQQNQEILIEFLASQPQHLTLILTSVTLTTKNAFVQSLQAFAKVVDFGQKSALSVFDMTNALDRRRQADALQLLTDLMASGQHPLQIMGGLIWFWRQKKGRISAKKFEEGLQFLQEADLNIKRSRLLPEYAMEMLVIKLGTLLAV
jgi:DNA polymerase III delta subunit